MPRGPRLDAPGILQHVMARGIEKTLLFRTDEDREDFVRRLAGLVEASGTQVLAWALLPNHLHLLVRTGGWPLASVMRRLLTGYAGAFNRRHKRHGHLFQNRYKSIVVEEEPYFLELTRYIHLNPLRARLVRDMATLDGYPWSGHSAVLGRVARSWQPAEVILRRFAKSVREARRRYRAFIAAGVPQGRRPELQGGGLRRSAGGWEAVAMLRRGREAWAFDERVLGTGDFVERILREAIPVAGGGSTVAWHAVPVLVDSLASVLGVRAAEIQSGSRRRPASRARAAVGAIAVEHLGLPATRVAKVLGVTGMAILRGIERGLNYLRERHLDAQQLAKAALRKV